MEADYSAGSDKVLFVAKFESNPDASKGVVWGANILGLISGANLASNALDFGINKIQDYAIQKGIQIALSPLLQNEQDIRFINVGFIIRGEGIQPSISDVILLHEYHDDPNPVPLGIPINLGYTLQNYQVNGPKIVSKRYITELPFVNQNYVFKTVQEIGHISESYFTHDVYFQTSGVVTAYRTQNETSYLLLAQYPGSNWFGSMTSNKFIAIPTDHKLFEYQAPSIGSIVHLTGKTQNLSGQNERRIYFENDQSQDLSIVKTIKIHDFLLMSGSFIPIEKIPLDTRLFQFSLDPSGSWTAIIHLPKSTGTTVNSSNPLNNQILLNTLYRGERSNYIFFERDGQFFAQGGKGDISINGYSFGLSTMQPNQTSSNEYYVRWGSAHGRSSVRFEFGVDQIGNHYVNAAHDLGVTQRFIAHPYNRNSVCDRFSAAKMASSYFSPACSFDPVTYTPHAILDLNRSGRKAFIFQSCAGPETRGRFAYLIVEKRADCTELGSITTYSPNTVFEINYDYVEGFTSNARGYTFNSVAAGDIRAKTSEQIMIFKFDIDSQRYRFTSLLSD